jgi:hypothetical protein
MPLKPGNSKATVSKNISHMVHSGHPQKVAVAAALNEARESTKHNKNCYAGPMFSGAAIKSVDQGKIDT